MGSLTAILHMASGAIAANQTALDATAENISNQNTPGYSRRTVSWSEGDTVSVGDSGSNPGVRSTVVSTRDSVLVKATQQAAEAASASSARVSALDNLQQVFMLDASGNDAAGIGPAISDFFNSATALASTPNDATARQTVLAKAQVLVSAMNRASAQLSSQTASLNATVQSQVQQVNTLAAKVAALNQQIVSAGPAADTSGLMDQRDQLVTQVAQLVNVNTITNSDGSINLAMGNGASLVAGMQALPLQTQMASSLVDVVANPAAGGGALNSSITGGSIGGELQVRDGALKNASAALDSLASAIVNAVNTQNAAGIDANGAVGGEFFSGTSASTMAVAISDPNLIAAGSDGSNAVAMGQIQMQNLAGGHTLSLSLASMIGSIGQVVSDAKTQSAADSAVLTQTQTQMAAASGVSLDTEAANLTQYQRSYEAAAKVLAIVNELLAQAINLGQPTTVS